MGVLALVGIVGVIFHFFHQRASTAPIEPKNISRNQKSRPRIEIRGFSFNRNLDGKRVILIKADKFIVERKKIGFFTFSLMNVARFENALVKIYGRTRQPEDKSDKLHDNILQDLTFKDAISKEILSSLPVKRISSIVMKPIYVEIHDERSIVTRITADSAAVRLTKRNILFKGNIRVVSGSRVLTTNRLRMLPEKATLKTNGHFLLKTPEKQLEGRGLTPDVFLRPVTS